MKDGDREPVAFGLGAAVVRKLLAMGVGEVVIASGARNLEVAVAAWRARHLHCWNHFEERCAGFFALGRARARAPGGRPVAVLTTSGTAAAELLPAVIEAHYQGVPLVAVTADRPVEFRGTGAPQAIEQRALFGRYADWYDVEDAEGLEMVPTTLPAGPMHLNICLRELTRAVLERIPSVEEEPHRAVALLRVFEAPAKVEEFFGATLPERCLVVVGPVAPDQGSGVGELVEGLDCPVVAEAISNLRFSAGLAGRLTSGAGVELAEVEKVLRVGGVPTCRLWRDLEEWPSIEVAHLTDLPFTGLARGGDILGELPPAEMHSDREGQPGKGVEGSARNSSYGEVQFPDDYPDSEIGMIAALADVLPAGACIFLGNSLPIREWNRVFPLGKHRCFANRGANGIDGNLSTFLGLAAGEKGDAWAVVGDLTALYDLAASFILPQMQVRGRLRIVVVNNGGGKIFSRLSAIGSKSGESGDEALSLIENRHAADFEGMARLWGLAYRRIKKAAELADLGGAGVELWELVPDAVQTEAYWRGEK